MQKRLNQLQHSKAFTGRRVIVYGLGRFGGGVGVVRFLASHGARVSIADDSNAEQLGDSIAKLDGVKVESWHLGCDLSDLPGADLLVVNPAIKPSHPVFDWAKRSSTPVSTEIEIFCANNRAAVIAVTGSNGKSTTVSMISHVLEESGRTCHVGGNIGGSLLDRIDAIAAEDVVVLELSSFQLARLPSEALSPIAAVVTNFAANHLDWHPSLDHYRTCKQKLINALGTGGTAILPGDSEFDSWRTPEKTLMFGPDRGENGVFQSDGCAVFRTTRGEEAVPMWPLRISGAHNIENSLAAAATVFSIGVEPIQIAGAMPTFGGLPFRLQPAGAHRGINFVNDSSATTPESAVQALLSFRQPVVFIGGGADKGVDLTSFAKMVATRARAAQWLGTTGPMLFDAAQAANSHFTHACHDTLDAAFAAAVDVSNPGDIVILSPGCASLGMYVNYQQRGQHFDQLVQRLSQSEPF